MLGVSYSDESATCFLPYRWLPANTQGRFRFLRRDLNHDLDSLMAALEGYRSRYVINFAARGMVAQIRRFEPAANVGED